MTARALLYYSLGLWAFAGLRVFVSAFYSLQDTKTPVKVAAVAMAVNIVFSLILMRTRLEHGGLALALSLASTMQLVILIVLLRRRIGGIQGRVALGSMAKSLVSALIMAVCIYWLSRKLFAVMVPDTILSLTIGVLVLVGAGALIYIVLTRILRCRELASIGSVVKRSRTSG
jgi:putative peptidoglycan lipid II flippase